MIFPGFTFIDNDPHEKDSKYQKKGGGKGAASGPREKLSHFDDCTDHVILHTYKIESKKGVYRASKRLDECIALSPGMVVNGMVWGEKILQTFKEQKEDIVPFQYSLVQLKIMSNSASNASENGRMLEIKNIVSLDSNAFSPSAFKLLKAEGVLANSIQAAAVLREKILDGSFITGGHTKEHLNQKLIQGSLSSTVQVLALTPHTSNGLFGMGADGKIRFFLHQPIADVKAYSIHLTFDRKAHYCPADGSNDDWMIKLLNVGIMLDAVQLLVIIDSYKNKDVAEADLHLEGFARVDLSIVLKKILACSRASELGQGVEEDPRKKAIVSIFEAQGMGHAVKSLYVYPLCAPNLDLVIDTRKINNKRFDEMDDALPHSTTLVHHEAKWKKGHMLYAFFEGKSVLSAVIPEEEGGAALFNDRAKRSLESTVQFADLMKDIEFEEEAPTSTQSESAADGAGKGSKKKAKTTASQ